MRRILSPRTQIRLFLFALFAAIPVGLLAAATAARADVASRIISGHETSFNWFATATFACAVIHTFLSARFMALAHKFEKQHREEVLKRGGMHEQMEAATAEHEVSFKAELFHFLGEIEVIFGLWVVPLMLGMIYFHGWEASFEYLNGLHYTEPMFVLVIMTIAASRPVVSFAQAVMALFAGIGRHSVGAWWLSILCLGPILGSFITEPAAMTICSLLLSKKFFDRYPSTTMAYGTLGLLFVNVSIGGTLTHFAAPPVLMVAGKWGWGMDHMFIHFGWKAVLAILVSNLAFWLAFRKEFARMNAHQPAEPEEKTFRRRTPKGLVLAHLGFLAWTVMTNHYPVLFIGGFLFFLGFTQATAHHQDDLALRTPLLVAFFLAGLVIHGSLQAWWIQPLLGRLGPNALFWGAVVLTAFNDNAAITYLASLVPDLTETMRYAVVAGAVAGGGLTVIANAPNPAGVAILGRFFKNGISPGGLVLGAIFPTLVAALAFLVL